MRLKDSLMEQEALDALIAHHAAIVAETKLRRNALSPVSRIPPEILGEIFTICVRFSMEPRERGVFYFDDFLPYQWLQSVAHVCHAWREVALNTSQLWDTIYASDSREDLVIQSIERAGQRLLDLYITDAHVRVSGDLLELVLPEVKRARLLQLQLEPDSFDVAHEHFPSVALHLRSLDLEISRPDLRLPEDDWPSLPDFLKFLIADAVPLLEELRLKAFYVDWSPGMFPPLLTRLSIGCRAVEMVGEDVTYLEIAKILGGLPLLEDLTLEGVIPNNLPQLLDALPHVPAPVSLSRLQRFSISGTAVPLAHFLDHFVLPSSTKITLTLTSIVGANNISPLVGPFAAKLNTFILPDDQRGTVEMLVVGRGSLSFYKRETKVPSLKCPKLSPHLRIDLPSTNNLGGFYLFFLFNLCPHLPLRDVQVLCIQEPCLLISMAWWTPLLSVLNNVKVLIRETEDVDLLRLLNPDDPDAEPNAQPRFYLPKLKKLVFREFSYSDESGFISSLCGALKVRRNGGVPIEVVDMSEASSLDDVDPCFEVELRRLVVLADYGKRYPLLSGDVDPSSLSI